MQGRAQGRSGNSRILWTTVASWGHTMDFPMGFQTRGKLGQAQSGNKHPGVSGLETRADRGPAGESVGPGERCKRRALLPSLVKTFRAVMAKRSGRGAALLCTGLGDM